MWKQLKGGAGEMKDGGRGEGGTRLAAHRRYRSNGGLWGVGVGWGGEDLQKILQGMEWSSRLA